MADWSKVRPPELPHQRQILEAVEDATRVPVQVSDPHRVQFPSAQLRDRFTWTWRESAKWLAIIAAFVVVGGFAFHGVRHAFFSTPVQTSTAPKTEDRPPQAPTDVCYLTDPVCVAELRKQLCVMDDKPAMINEPVRPEPKPKPKPNRRGREFQ